MNLGEFHALVSSSLNRGTSLDSSIPDKVRQAVRWIERNYTFQYMRRWVEGSIDASVATPYIIPLYDLRPKAIEAFRLIDSETSKYRDLKRIDPKERNGRGAWPPSGYWLDGVNSIILDAEPTEDQDYEIHLHQYTALPTDTDFQHWLIDNAEDLLLFTSLWYMGVSLRDDRMISAYKLLREEAMQTLHIAEQDIQHNDRDAVMHYSPPYDIPERGDEDGTE